MRKGKRPSCLDESSILKEILKSKHNRKVLENNDIRIGDDMALNSKTNIIYKLKENM